MFDFIINQIIHLGVFFSEYFRKKDISDFKAFIIIFSTFFPLALFACYWIEPNKIFSRALYYGTLLALVNSLGSLFLLRHARRKEKEQNKDK